ncbi:MAG: hypothetical protein IJP30_01980 [Clostridia bacterium]|nr:hypothetical protein [Clostridia bacterium]
MAVFAAIDIGTHSVRLLLRENGQSKKFVTVTRLGEGSAQTKRLTEAAMARTEQAVADFLAQARAAGAAAPVWCYATSAARECENGAELIERLNRLSGLSAQIIPGEMEAVIACRGAAAPGCPVLDIGGGSTELICQSNGGLRALSVPMGTVTLQEKYAYPPEQVKGQALAELNVTIHGFAHRLVSAVLPGPVPALYGVGGTATQLAMLFLKLREYDAARVQDYVMPIEAVEALLEKLTSMNTEQRKALPGMHPARADVIVTGARITCAMLRCAGADRLIASDRDGLDGYLSMQIEKTGLTD